MFACALGGCVIEQEDPARLDLGVDPQAGALAASAAYRDTIGSYSHYEGMRAMRVRGYGLVVGLGKNGSRDCPRPIYDQLVQSLYKQHRFSTPVVGTERITPEQMINGIDTAVVLVQGEIPAGAVAEDRFDVAVMALPGTQTKSLRGGRLYTTELHVFRPTSPTTSITGKVLAKAAGPVFLNPFSDGDSATRTTPLEGVIAGGGVTLADRRIRLVLMEPSYLRAKQIRDRINAQYAGPMLTADATSPSFIQLRVPGAFHGDTAHFLALTRALYLSQDSRFEATRARLLADEMIRPNAPHEHIALALEGLGRRSLPVLADLYAHPKAYVSFHAAAAGLRLGDHVACDTMAVHARDPAGEHRFQAIRALGQTEGMAGAAMTLRQLLHDDDPRVQVEAYEQLIARGDPIIRSTPIAGDAFVLDLIPTARSTTSRGGFVYVKRSGSHRIALFGQDLRCMPPVFYRAPDGSLTINADPGQEMLTIVRVAVSSGSVSAPIPAPTDLPSLVALMGRDADVGPDGEVLGLGLDYGAVARALYHLCEDGSVNATFRLEQPNVAELMGPPRRAGRPESEL
jgi:flagellar basal body P-ring protein FlgI